MSLYGTDLWDGLTEEQRITLSKHEVASIASVGLWFELLLMQMMLRDLYDDDPTGAHMHYALTEVADECRHSTMFGKSIAHFGVPAYGPPQKIHRLGRLFNHVVRGPSAYASILVAEELLDTWQRELMKDERVQPITRMVARIHVLEEARHMTFAREEVKRQLEGISRAQLVVQQTLTAQTCLMVARSLVNPKVYALRRHRPARGSSGGAGQPALPRDDAVDGREAARLPPRERPAAEEPGAGLAGLAAAAVMSDRSRLALDSAPVV